MSDILAARSQMAISLVFQIIFTAIGVALPLMMMIAEALWLRTQDATYLWVAKRWAKGTAILFAIGAVSGTVLSFELRVCCGRVLWGLPVRQSACRFRLRALPSSRRPSFLGFISMAGRESLREFISWRA